VPRPLDGACERTLVLRAVSRDAPADDFSLLGQELGEPVDFFVINEGYLFTAKTADFLSEKTATPAAAGTARAFLILVPTSASASTLTLTLTLGASLGAFSSHGELKRDLFIG